MYFYHQATVTMYPKLIFFILTVYLNILIVYSCEHHKTCHQCITDPGVCVWCASADPSFDKEPRCRSESSYDPKWCSGALDIPDKANVFANETFNRDFSSATGAVVQIKPQLYNIKLRPGQTLNFTFSFQGAKDYPVDLYILLDASETMSAIKDDLEFHSENIYNTMQKMTKNVNIGFGTFIDKNIQPFTLDVKRKQAYSFRHRLNLTSEYKAFKTVVSGTNFSHNYDSPEGGFDALAQVIVCEDIGWREKSRKIIVFHTDSSHHTVGDSRSAGIFQPYDGKCYTNEEGIYTKELEMDYPSVTMINRLAIEKKVIIIFTLRTHEPENLYDSLIEAIQGSKMAVLSDSDIVTHLRESYKEISTSIKLDVGVKSGHGNNFQIKFHPDCTKSVHDVACKVETGERRDFAGTITLTEYYGKDTELIDISVQGMTEKLTLNVEVIRCACEESEDNIVDNLEHCSGQKFQCGVCICDKSRYGSRCICKKDEISKEAVDNSLCVAPGGGSKLCSENGECECGLCNCNKKINFGRFCECYRSRCPGYNATGDVECSGHGECDCSGDAASGRKEMCSCHKEWSHKPELDDCSCHLATNLCMLNNTICNNRGNCTCNSCECEPIPDWDKRIKQNTLCQLEPCPSCHSLQCSVIQTCVLCHLDSKNCKDYCNGIVLDKKYVDFLPIEDLNSTEWSVCENQKVDMGCYTKFVYRYDEKEYRILLRMQLDVNCARSYYMYGGVLLLTLLLGGILTLLAWKCLTRYQDRREFEKFEAEQKKLDRDSSYDNPLYSQPSTTFRNPAFKRSLTSLNKT